MSEAPARRPRSMGASDARSAQVIATAAANPSTGSPIPKQAKMM